MENILVDRKLKCCSIMKTMRIGDYLDLVEKAYNDRGGIKGQREPLRQKTAITIRKRMISDIVAGTILPPIVIGAIVDPDSYEKAKKCTDVLQFFEKTASAKISIIDGMQRTTAIIEAKTIDNRVGEDSIRVEFWISCDVNSMFYRMLVLNTGQVPWNMRRQIELIFDGVISQITNTVQNITVFKTDDGQRRKKGGQYNADDLVEMFLAFGSRTWKIDTKEKVTDEFTRGDFVQSSGEADMVSLFCQILDKMCQIDVQLTKGVKNTGDVNQKFKKGMDLFSSQPAKIGFAAACGEKILGRPGESLSNELIETRMGKVLTSLQTVVEKMKETDDLSNYIDFDTLSEVISRKSIKVGDYEREKFYSAFKVLIETDGLVDSFTVCWRA